MRISVDGYVAGPNGETDWWIWDWDDKLTTFWNYLLDGSDTILLGRKMAEIFIPHFEGETSAYAGRMVSMPKVVFSKKIKTIAGKNVSVENGDLATAVKKLKGKEGRDIAVYGGAGFVSSLIKEGLIDEFYFLVHPVLINKGMRIFDLLEHRQNLSLISATPYECGVTVLCYKLNNK